MCRFTTANDANYRKVGGELYEIYRMLKAAQQLDTPIRRKPASGHETRLASQYLAPSESGMQGGSNPLPPEGCEYTVCPNASSIST